jgi:hypothetical protein
MYEELFESILRETFETKFKRILQKAGFYNNYNAMDFCTITAFRDEINKQKVPLKTNRQRNREFDVFLRELAREKGYGYRHQGVTGGFQGKDSHGTLEQAENEESYIITHNPNDRRSTSREFYEDMTTLAGVATQAGVLIKLAAWPTAKILSVHTRGKTDKAQTYTSYDEVFKEPDKDKVFDTGKARLTTSQDSYYTKLRKRGKNGVGAKEKAFSFANDGNIQIDEATRRVFESILRESKEKELIQTLFILVAM